MAPFNTHFLVAEKIWPQVTARLSLSATVPHNPFGQFCFGCVAPDVDKASPTLAQRDTHFFDRTTAYELMAAHRSAAFLHRQNEFLRRPFADLSPEEQAFALGYLCHLCVDEVSKHMWRRPTWRQLNGLHVGTAFAALDELARRKCQNYHATVRALGGLKILNIIPRIPPDDLKRMHQGTCHFGQAESIEGEYLALLDLFDRPTPAEREKRRQILCTQIEAARQLVHIFQLDKLVSAAVAHSRQRFDDLFAGRLPEPGYPALA